MKILFAFLFVVFSFQSLSQESLKSRKNVDLYWQLYACNLQFRGDAYAAFQNQFPNSSILSAFGSQVDETSMLTGSGQSTAMSFGVGVPVTIFKSSKFVNSIRLSYDGLGKVTMGAGIYDETRVRQDSTFYPQYNASLMKDSVYVDQITGFMSGNVHQVKADLLFRFRPEKQFTLYSGLGIGLAMTTNRKIEVSQNYGSYVEVTSAIEDDAAASGNSFEPQYYFAGNPNTELEELAKESYTLKTGFSMFSYIPYGLDLKMSKKDNLLSKFHVYTEGQVGARFSDVYLNTKQTTFYFSTQLGVRVTL
tara:strand:+ start:16148 stop:17065 length:918 start_codon:yes stop_codon:yes gene_type:complete